MNETVDYLAPESWVGTSADMQQRQQVKYINLQTTEDPSEEGNLVENTKEQLNKDI